MTKKLVFFSICIIISIVLIFHIDTILHEKNSIDSLEEILLPVRNSIPLNSCLSFKSNNEEDISVYFQSQLAMTPVVVASEYFHDTLLFVEDKLKEKEIGDTLKFNQGVLLMSFENEKYKVSLFEQILRQ